MTQESESRLFQQCLVRSCVIGCKFADPLVPSNMRSWPFKVIHGSGDKPMIEVRTCHPQGVSSMVFTKVKETPEAYLSTNVIDAVVTSPAHFKRFSAPRKEDARSPSGLNL